MVARLRAWWQKRRKSLTVIGLIAVLIAVIALISLEVRVNGSGFSGKSLWDWLQLLIVPLALALIAFLFNRTTTRAEQNIAADRTKQDRQIATQRYEQDQKIAVDKQREDLLQTYLDRMSALLLEKELGLSPSDAVKNVARVRTITILVQLDVRRIGYVFAFLHEAGLMSTKKESIVSLKHANLSNINFNQASLSQADLSEANLRGADLFHANLIVANLSEANLTVANLSEAYLSGAYLSRANLSEANLRYADLSGAELSQADLSGANLTGVTGITVERLEKEARSLKDAIMPDGTIHS